VIGNALVARFIVSRICSSLGDQVLMFAVPLIVYRYTNSVAMSGSAFFIEWLPRLLLLPIAGTITDRLGGPRIYAVADGSRAAASLAAAAIVLCFPQGTFAAVVALIALSAIVYSQVMVATEVTIARLVDTAHMAKTQSLLQAVEQSAYIAGPALAAVCVVWLRPVALLWGIAVLFALSAGLAWTLRSRLAAALTDISPRADHHVITDLLLGIGIVRRTPVVMKLTGLGITANLLVGFAFATSAAMTVGKFGLANSYYGVLQVVIGGMALLSYALVPQLTKHVSVFTLGMASYTAIVAGGLLMSVAPTFALYALGLALASGLCGLFNVYVRSERIQWIPREDLGKALGVIAMLNQAALPLAGLIVWLGGTRINVQMFFGVTAGAAGLLCLALASSLGRTCKTAAFQRRPAAGLGEPHASPTS
jgi:MFS family permease